MKPKDNSLPEGSKVYITHYRYSDNYDAGMSEVYDQQSPLLVTAFELREGKFNILPRGGMTEVVIDLPDGTQITTTSVCSKRDNFSRKIGRNIALGRAMKEVREWETI